MIKEAPADANWFKIWDVSTGTWFGGGDGWFRKSAVEAFEIPEGVGSGILNVEASGSVKMKRGTFPEEGKSLKGNKPS